MIVHITLYLNLPSDTGHATFSGGVTACFLPQKARPLQEKTFAGVTSTPLHS